MLRTENLKLKTRHESIRLKTKNCSLLAALLLLLALTVPKVASAEWTIEANKLHHGFRCRGDGRCHRVV